MFHGGDEADIAHRATTVLNTTVWGVVAVANRLKMMLRCCVGGDEADVAHTGP